ncbi:unnamed protein product [Brachionus calyciflorus]|uniref:Transmembrane protein n=1 Tax=Brachionus calyciflorus TaxID=104777 RepID=A0A813XGD3_9BILA|nr:unnamed protein product [Brachionus calyciflorus]
MSHNVVVIGMDAGPPNYNAAMNTPNDSTELPPSYNSLFNQLQRAKEESTNPADYALKACGILCGSIIITIIFAISSAIPITMIIIGAIYKDQCTIDHKIPIWLIVSGVFGCLSAIIRTIQNCYSIYKKRQNESYEQGKKSCITSVIELFIFSWFICGNVWVYSAKSSVVTDNQLDPFYCHATCYYFAFWVITVSWIVMALLCCCCCCILVIAGCGAGIASIFSSK